MKFVKLSVEQIIRLIGEAKVHGAGVTVLAGIASLKDAEPTDLAFLGNPKYKKQVPLCDAGAILVPREYEGAPKRGQVFIRVARPSFAFSLICSHIEQQLQPHPTAGIHPSAFVDSQASVASSASIGPGCVIEEGASVGEHTVLRAQVFLGRYSVVGKHCWLMPQVTIKEYCRLGSRVRLNPGVVIGSDGFGYEEVDGSLHREPQIGIVVIEDDVDVGANTAIDRARFKETRIRQGTKIDNLVQIGHNVTIGRHCLIVGQAGISGSTTLEDAVVIGGQAGTAGHITLGRGSKVGGQSGVIGNLDPGAMVNGTPAMDFWLTRRTDALKKQLPHLFKRVGKIEAFIEALQDM